MAHSLCAAAGLVLKLGLPVREREALAVFARADARRRGAIPYLDLAAAFFGGDDAALFQQNPRNAPPVLDELTL